MRWLTTRQTAPSGFFRPICTDGFHPQDSVDSPFDQQPVEAQATIAACVCAWKLTKDPFWQREAQKAFDWFLGFNDLSTPLVDTKTGLCRDGLHADRPNENCGAESVLAYLLSLCDMHAFSTPMPNIIRQDHLAKARDTQTTRPYAET